MKKFRGFTLMELMIVVAIVAILAAVALPSYNQYIVRANRATAKAEMMDISTRQQQFFLANRVYGNLADLGLTNPLNINSRYNCVTAPGVASPPSYLTTCTPISGSPQASDGILTIDNLGNKSPADKW